MTLLGFSSTLDPVSGLLALQRELERALENPLDFDLGVSGRGVFPALNIFRDEDGFVIRLEVPGLSPEQFSIETQGHTLTIKGTREITVPAGGSFHRRERGSGQFSRSVKLPDDADMSDVKASYRYGLLTVKVPRKKEAKPRQITVQAN